MGDFNLALLIVAIVVCVLVLLVSVYLLVNYQHPDDKNQAYFPKFVVILGISIAIISILMLPADVANRQACRHAIYNGACNLTLPMKDLWLAVYIVDAILVFFVIPFSMFYYEGDQDKSVMKRARSAFCYVVVMALACALLLGILYVFMGKVDFTVKHLSSPTTAFPGSWTSFSSSKPCIGQSKCSAFSANPGSEKTWTMRTTFPEYVVALATIVGSVLFTIFGGVGIVCLPLGLIFSFIRRPKAVITRSQYIKEATELGKKARELKKAADALHQEERSGSKGRKWRKNVKAVEKELLLLEDDVKALEEMYPQGEKAETTWAFTVLGYLLKLILGVAGLIFSVAWIAHIIIYLLVNPPLSPFLNQVFIKLDDVWGLLGTAAFAFFCFYLLLAVIAGAMMLGLRLVFITIHPMKGFKDPSFRVIQNHFAASGNLGEVAAKINLKRARLLVKSHVQNSLIPGYAECNKEGNILSWERLSKPRILYGIPMEDMFEGDSSCFTLKELLKLYAREKHILVARQHQLTGELEFYVTFKVGATSLSVLRSLWQSYWLVEHWKGSNVKFIKLEESLLMLEEKFSEFLRLLEEGEWDTSQINLKVPKDLAIELG